MTINHAVELKKARENKKSDRFLVIVERFAVCEHVFAGGACPWKEIE